MSLVVKNLYIFSGNENSGKSTLIKQMQILYGGFQFSQEEKQYYKKVIHMTILEDIQSLILEVEKQEIAYGSMENKKIADHIKDINIESSSDTIIMADILCLWNDPVILSCFSKQIQNFKASSRYFIGTYLINMPLKNRNISC